MLSRPLPATAATLVLFTILSVLFAPAILRGKILAPLDITTTLLPPWNENANGAKPRNQSPSDAVTQYLPYRMFAEESLRKDGYIGWNPYEMGGYSLAANTMALPGSWPMQLHRWLPFKHAWNLGIIGEFVIAGIGMLVFLRGRDIPWLPCLIGSVAFMLNAQFIVWIYHRWALGSFCWMPWVLWAYGDGFATRPLPRRIFLLPAFLALALLGGSLQHMAFVILACGCLAVAHCDFRKPLHITPVLTGWLLAFVLALGVTAFSLVPQIQGYLANVAIGHVRGGIGYEHGILQILYHIVLIPARIWPWLAGDPQSMDAFRLLKGAFMDLNYLGTIPMLLGLAGLFVRSMPRAAKWLVITGLLIPLTPLVGPLYHRVELLFILGAAWMTAEMLSHQDRAHPASGHSRLVGGPSGNRSRTQVFIPLRFPTLHRLLISAVIFIGIALMGATIMPSGIRGTLEQAAVSKAVSRSDDSQFGADQEWIASRAIEWTRRFSLGHPRTAWVYGLLVLGSAGLLLSASGATRSDPHGLTGQHGNSPAEKPGVASLTQISHPAQPFKNTISTIPNQKPLPLVCRRSIGHMLILCATTLEAATLFHTWTTFSDPANLRPHHPSMEAIASVAGPHRVLQRSPGAHFVDMFATPNLLASFAIPSVDAYESIQYPSSLLALKGTSPDVQLALAGVALAVHTSEKPAPAGTESWPASPLTSRHTLRIHPAPPPPIAVVKGEVPTSPDTILAALAKASAIAPTHHTPNRMTLRMPRQDPQSSLANQDHKSQGSFHLRIAQNWHPGWKWRHPGKSWQAFSNGPDAACWITNLPADPLQIEVRFFPRPLWLSLSSLGTLIVWLGIIIMGLAGRLSRAASTPHNGPFVAHDGQSPVI